MAKLYLDVIRHGETKLLKQGGVLRGRLDDKLTQAGYEQMHETFFGHIKQSNWQVLFTSNLSRCADFAKDCAKACNLPYWQMPNLQEIDFGDWEGMATADLYAKFPEQLATYWQTPHLYTPPNAESVADFKGRIITALDEMTVICQQNQHDKACVISHGGVIKMLYHLSGQVSIDALLTVPAELGQLHRFVLEDGVICATI